VRVAQVMAGAAHGGAELFFERLCIGLHQAGETVLPVIRGHPGRKARLLAAGLEPAELGFGGPLDILTTPRLLRILEQFAPDVVVSWMNRATSHVPPGNWVHVGRLGAYYDLRHYRACHHLVGNTQGIVAWLRANGWPPARTHYLPNFVADFADAEPSRGLPGHGPILLGLGRLHTDKGFDTLLRALPRLPGARLLIAGAGPEGARLRHLAKTQGVADRTWFLGWRGDVAGLLAACDVFVCSSRVEPLGNMVLEAWSARRPIVAADAAGPAELIRNEQDGLLVPREQPEALAEAIGRLLRDAGLAASLAQRGRNRFAQEFAPAPVTERWLQFLEEVAR
jgi:glycosyltransferase involved in cell wall biosynthesis